MLFRSVTDWQIPSRSFLHIFLPGLHVFSPTPPCSSYKVNLSLCQGQSELRWDTGTVNGSMAIGRGWTCCRQSYYNHRRYAEMQIRGTPILDSILYSISWLEYIAVHVQFKSCSAIRRPVLLARFLVSFYEYIPEHVPLSLVTLSILHLVNDVRGILQ